MSKDLPTWARRIRAMREAKGWTQRQAVEELRRHSKEPQKLPEADSLERRWKAWEAGDYKPRGDYAPLVAATLGTVTKSLFPPEPRASSELELVNAAGMNTLEIVSRLSSSDINDATLDAVALTVEKLCSEYARVPATDLIQEGRQWLRRLVEMQERRITFRQRRETLELVGWLTLLVGCLEYDLGDKRAAEGTRRSALGLGKEIESPGVLGWAHEMRAWFALTSGDYRALEIAAKAGQEAAGSHSVSVQLIAHEAKALARLGRREEMRRTLERGRVLLDDMPYPENVDNHFVVDPSKFDFYAMDCYRHVGENNLARELSEEVIRASTDVGGYERWPMRVAEAQVTLGVIAAREGDLDEAVMHGHKALSGDRKSLPSLALASRDLSRILSEKFSREPETVEYLDKLNVLQRPNKRSLT